jgi:hypothetical protein
VVAATITGLSIATGAVQGSAFGASFAAAGVSLSAFGFAGGVQGNQTDTAALRAELVAAKVIT